MARSSLPRPRKGHRRRQVIPSPGSDSGEVIVSVPRPPSAMKTLTAVILLLKCFSIFVLVASKGWKPAVAPSFQRSTVNLNHCARLFFSLALSTKPTLPPIREAKLRAFGATASPNINVACRHASSN